MELKMRITVLFIPTVSVKTHYGIVCPKCKNGFEVNEKQRDFVLKNGPDCVKITKEGVKFLGIEDIEPMEPPKPQPVIEEKTQTKELCACGAELTEGMVFCSKCGARVQSVPIQAQTEVKPVVVQTETKVQSATAQEGHKAQPLPKIPEYRSRRCPNCKMHVVPGKTACTYCGTTVE